MNRDEGMNMTTDDPDDHETYTGDLRQVLAELDAFRDRFIRQIEDIQARLNQVIAEQAEEARQVSA
jgi:ABC-type Zn uptake system ZnuABC Zn-binding protein ZnuA